MSNDTCYICTRSADSPYRRYDEHGKVLEGCVADFHTGHLVTPSESSFWHNRPEAKKIRQALNHARLHGTFNARRIFSGRAKSRA